MTELTKSLGPVSGTAMMLNTVLGAGILILPGLAAQQIGAMSIWTWALCALANIPLLAMFALLASRYPEAGGVGHIAGRAFGSFGNVITSFLFLGAVFVGLPSIALTGGYYLGDALGIDHWIAAIFLVGVATGANFTLPGTASRLGSYIAAGVIAMLVILLVASWYTVWGNPAVGATDTPIPAPNLSIIAPFMLVFFAFTGWEVAIGTSEEFRDPRRDIPRAVFASFVIAVGFYIACALVIIAAGPVAFGNAPFLTILAPTVGSTLAIVLAGGAAVMIAANLFAAVWAVSRMLFSLSREGQLPMFLSGSQRGMPLKAVGTTGIIVICVVMFDAVGVVDVDVLFATAGQNFLLIYGVSAAAFFTLSTGVVDRVIAAIVMIMVVGIIYIAGLNLIYPITLIMAAGALVIYRQRFPSVSEPSQP